MRATRTVLTLAGPSGEKATLDEALPRFSFERAYTAGSTSEMLQRMREQKFDLLILPMENMNDKEMAEWERELQRHPSANVIATAQKADPNLILKALRAGIHEFLVSPITTSDIIGAVGRLRNNHHKTDGKRGRVIAVYGAKGGLGTSTIALNLAFQFARMKIHPHVALADLVLGRGDIRVLLNLNPTYDINDLVARQDRVDENVLFSLLTVARGINSEVWVLPSSEDQQTADKFDADSAARVISHLQSHFDIIIADCESYLSDHTTAVLDTADNIVLVTQLTIPVLRNTQRTLQRLRQLGYADDKITIVINRFHSGDVVSIDEAGTIFNQNFYYTLPNDFRACTKAVARGIPVVVHDPESSLAQAIAGLAGKIVAPQSDHRPRNEVTATFSRSRRSVR